MKRTLQAIFLLLFLVIPAMAENIEVQHVRELIKPADVIARVTILFVRQTGANEGYSKIATAIVTDAIKGVQVDSVIELENDVAGILCPNVRYVEGEDVLLFAQQLPNGHYETVYVGAGKILIVGERVHRRPFRQNQSFLSARAQSRREMKRQERRQP